MKTKPQLPATSPNLHDSIELLKRALTFLSTAGIKIEWTNHNGALVLSFRGLVLKTNPQSGTAQIVSSKDIIEEAIQKNAN